MNFERILVNALEAGLNADTVAFALAAIGLNVHFGYTGLLNFGQSAFLAVAAYGIGVSVATFGLPLWLGVIVGLLAAVVLALPPAATLGGPAAAAFGAEGASGDAATGARPGA